MIRQEVVQTHRAPNVHCMHASKIHHKNSETEKQTIIIDLETVPLKYLLGGKKNMLNGMKI